jgi:hypothetical protein
MTAELGVCAWCTRSPAGELDLARWLIYVPSEQWVRDLSPLPGGIFTVCRPCSALIDARDIGGLVGRAPDDMPIGEHGAAYVEAMIETLPEPILFFDYWADLRQSAEIDGEATESADPGTGTQKTRRPWRSGGRGRRGGNRGRRR